MERGAFGEGEDEGADAPGVGFGAAGDFVEGGAVGVGGAAAEGVDEEVVGEVADEGFGHVTSEDGAEVGEVLEGLTANEMA